VAETGILVISLQIVRTYILNKKQQFKTPTRQSAQMENLEKREFWHKIVFKVILWKEENPLKRESSAIDKLTPSEWKIYRSRILKANMAGGVEKIQTRLKKTWQQIRENDGFVT
jgi:hypothetical protein